MLILCALLNGFISCIISAIFNRSAYFLISFFAVVILNIQLLSLFKSINGFNILILTAFEALIAFIIWNKKKYPLLKISFPHQEIIQALKEDKSLVLLAFAWLIFIVVSFILCLIAPVTEADAQSYHVLRVLYWLKDGFISHFESADIRNICLPINSELFYTWIMALTKKDLFLGFLQFFSYFQLIFCSFKIMEKFNIELKNRLWAILIFSSFAIIVIQTSSTQTDLCVGALLVSSIYFILEYKKTKTFNLLFFSSLAMGISFGVKTTSFMAGVPILIWFIFILRKDFIKFFGLLFFNSFIFSAYNYILNFIDFGNFFSNEAFYLYNKSYGGIKGFISNIIKYTFQFFDFSGFNIGNSLNDYILKTRDAILDILSIPINACEIDPLIKVNVFMQEQKGGFGILGFLVFIPCLILGLFSKKTRIFALLFFVSALILCILMAYTIFGIRYFVGFVCLALPVLSLSYFKKMNILKFIFVVYAMIYMGCVSLFSPVRPLAYFIKDYSFGLENIQNKMRNLEYVFFGPYISTQAAAFKQSAEPYCKNGNKIAIFAPIITMLYPVKYLEMNNNCTIDTLNMLHTVQYNLRNYDVIILSENMLQHTKSIYKSDIDHPLSPLSFLICSYVITDKGTKPGLKSAIEAVCGINKSYIENMGFENTGHYYYLRNNNDEVETTRLDSWVKK